MHGIRTDDRAFTPLAGTGLLVGVVVLLLAVVGAAMFGFIDSVAPPDAEFQVEMNEDDELVITYLAGDPIPAEELYVRGEDPDEAVRFGGWPGGGVVEPGDQVTIERATGNENVDVVWESAAFTRQATLAEYEGEESAISEWAEEEGVGTAPIGGDG